jgi:hypothetical protein
VIALPARLAPGLAGLSDPLEVEALLRDEMDAALSELASE